MLKGLYHEMSKYINDPVVFDEDKVELRDKSILDFNNLISSSLKLLDDPKFRNNVGDLSEIIMFYHEIFDSLIGNINVPNRLKVRLIKEVTDSIHNLINLAFILKLHLINELGSDSLLSDLVKLSWYKYDLFPDEILIKYNAVICRLLDKRRSITNILSSIVSFIKLYER